MYIIIVAIIIIIIICYVLIKLTREKSANIVSSSTFFKTEPSSSLEDDNMKYNLYDNILSVVTLPNTSRYSYMSSNNLLSESYNNSWFPTETSDKKYSVTFIFKRQVIVRKINIYTGLSNSNNKYTNLVIKNELGNIVYSNNSVVEKEFNIGSYDEIILPKDVDTTKITLEFTSKSNEFIIRKIEFYGIVFMKSKMEKLTGKHIYPNSSLNSYNNLLVKINKTPQEISSLSSLVGTNYNSQTKELVLNYDFSKIYCFYKIEIEQNISNLSLYGYNTLSVQSQNNIKSEPLDVNKLFKIFNDDYPSADSFASTSSLEQSINYTYSVYIDNIIDRTLKLTFNNVNNINDLRLIQIKFYAYDVVFGFFDNILISKNNWNPYNDDYLSLTKIELLNQDNQDVLFENIINKNAEITQFPNERDTAVKKIIISNGSGRNNFFDSYPIYKIDSDVKLYGYLSNDDRNLLSPISSQGRYIYSPESGKPRYVLDIRSIKMLDNKNREISPESYEVNSTSVFQIKIRNEPFTRIYSVISPPWNVKGMGAGYISHPEDKYPKITIIFKVPVNLGKIEFTLGSSSRTAGCRVELFNENNIRIDEQTIRPEPGIPLDEAFNTSYTRYTPTLIYPIGDNGSIYNVIDFEDTSSKTYPGFATWKNRNPTSDLLGPYIYIKFKVPVLLSGIRMRSTVDLIGTSVFASLGEGKSKKLLDTETEFSCIRDGNPYIAYRVNNNGKSECLSKDGTNCITSDTLDKCNREIYIRTNVYNNKECGTGSSSDCLYYQKNKINANMCIQDENGNFKKFYYKFNTNTQNFEISCTSNNNVCTTFLNKSDCDSFNSPVSEKICSEEEKNIPDSLCGIAKNNLTSTQYNNVFKSFEVTYNSVDYSPPGGKLQSERAIAYFPFGIALTEKSIVTLKNNMLLCLDEFNTSNNNTNTNIKLSNCNSNYTQIFRNKKYFDNSDDAIGTNKIYIPNIDKCLTYFQDKLVFRNCDPNLNYIQEFNINQNGNFYYPSSNSCINIDSNTQKNAILSLCSTSPKFQFLNLNNTECSSFNCENSIIFTNNNVKHMLLLDTDGMLKLLKINIFNGNVQEVVDLVNTKPDKFKKVNNDHVYPYNMKINGDGQLTCYDKNDKIVWITNKNDSLINPPYKLSHTYNLNNISIHIMNKFDQIITSF